MLSDNLTNKESTNVKSQKLEDNLYLISFESDNLYCNWYFVFNDKTYIMIETYNNKDKEKENPNIDKDVRNLISSIKWKYKKLLIQIIDI